MKTLIVILLFIAFSVSAQKGSIRLIKDQMVGITAFNGQNLNLIYFAPAEMDSVNQVPPPFASASITITITDNGQYTLADIRDNLCQVWGYAGAPNDNAAKLAFLKQYLINKIVNDYAAIKQQNAALLVSTQVNIN